MGKSLVHNGDFTRRKKNMVDNEFILEAIYQELLEELGREPTEEEINQRFDERSN